MIKLEGLRIAGLYLFLKERESELDEKMCELGEEIEAYLYERLSIEEMEELRRLYEDSDADLGSKI
ncbi:MAG: hypothetical protein PQJ61_03715 [Spirochaetales bacterium]|uniref:Uncharacterized protein n=1 Tax=Candidatus Thalassospirochaeta sargassi TaxID=3119039 RepID=A0AAJ1IAX4_9SPIO|nr:hypothetical protein [Spirochaetales bacterium]